MESNVSESEVTLHRCIPVCIFLRKTVPETCLTAVKVQRGGGGGGVAFYLSDAFTQLRKATFSFVTLVCLRVCLSIHIEKQLCSNWTD